MRLGDPIWTSRTFVARSVSALPVYDAIIIGGGYTGLATAYFLAQQGGSVLVIDRSDLSDAASARNAGFCTINPPIGLSALRAEGVDSVRAWYRWFEVATDHCEALVASLPDCERADIGFERVGNARLAQTPAQARALKQQAADLGALGIDRKFLSADALDLPDGGVFTAGLCDVRSARLNPGALHVALMAACQRVGADILLWTEAQDIQPGKYGVEVATAEGCFQARKVVVATNGFAETTIPPFRNVLFSVGSFLIRTQPLRPGQRLSALGQGRCHATSSRFPNYFRVTAQNELLFGGRASMSTQADIHSCASWLLEQARRLLPEVELPSVAACWGGRLGFTSDKKPLFGSSGPDLYYAMAYAGHGVPTSIAIGRELAQRMADCKPSNAAPFWREAYSPKVLPFILRRALPAAQATFKFLDWSDRLRGAFEVRFKERFDE